jgi:isopentenyl-diphosphate delta-isomerase
MYRAQNPSQARLAAAFLDWGIPTAESIQQVRRAAPDISIFASGGIRSGVEIAKCLGLGATLAGMAGPFLKAAVVSVEETIETILEIEREITVTMFAAGAENVTALADKLIQVS